MRPPVEAQPLHVRAPGGRAAALEQEHPAALHADVNLGEEGAVDREAADARDDGVQPERGEDDPRRGRAEVVVAGEPAGLGREQLVQHAARDGLRLPRLAGVVVNPGRGEDRLVADEEVRAVGARVELGEEAVQTFGGRLVPADALDDGAQVVRDHPRVLRRVALDVRLVALGPPRQLGLVEHGLEVEARQPRAVGPAPADVARLRVEQARPELRAAHHLGVGLLVIVRAREAGEGEVGGLVFERDGRRAAQTLLLHRDVAVLEEVREPRPHEVGFRPGLGVGRAFQHHLQRRARVEVARAEGPGAGDDGHRRVAVHRAALVVGHGPLGEAPAALLGHVDERLRHVARLFGEEPRDERRVRAVDVPAGEVRVLRVPRRLVHAVVEAHVLAVGVAEDVRVEQRVVERRVEEPPLGLGAAPHTHAPERPVPTHARTHPHALEVPGPVLRAQVRTRLLDAHVGDADLHADGAAVGGVERDEPAGLPPAPRGAHAVQHAFAVPRAERVEGAVELRGEVEHVAVARAAEGPARHHPAHPPVALGAPLRLLHARRVAPDVDKQRRGRFLGEVEEGEARARRGGQTHLDA